MLADENTQPIRPPEAYRRRPAETAALVVAVIGLMLTAGAVAGGVALIVVVSHGR